jgi:hypothetical protein
MLYPLSSQEVRDSIFYNTLSSYVIPSFVIIRKRSKITSCPGIKRTCKIPIQVLPVLSSHSVFPLSILPFSVPINNAVTSSSCEEEVDAIDPSLSQSDLSQSDSYISIQINPTLGLSYPLG